MEPGAARPGEDLLVHGRFLRGLARALVRDGERADDLVQDTWAAALEHPPRHADAPRAWLARILRRMAIRSGTREGERGAREEVAGRAGARESRAPDALASEIELARRVLGCVEALREPYKSTLYLRYWRGLEPQRIAAETDVPVKTVKTRLTRGLELVRAELDRAHGGRRDTWVALLLPLARGAPPVPAVPPVPAPAPQALTLAPVLALGAALAGAAALVALALHASRDAETAAVADARAANAPRVAANAPALAGGEESAGRRSLAADAPSVPAFDGVRLRGRVLDETGLALAGAEVSATPLASARRGPQSMKGDPREPEEPAVRAATDAGGAFELLLEDAGLVRLEIEHDGFAPLGHRLLAFAGQELDLGALALAPGAVIVGTVRDEDGAPVADAELLAERSDGGLVFPGDGPRAVRVATSAADGAFRVARLAAGAWRLRVRSATHAPGEARGSAAPGATVADVEVVLRSGAGVRGRVLGLDAAERERARIVARLPGEEDLDAARTAPVDAGGAFELAGLEPGAELELVALVHPESGGGPRRASEPVRVHAGDPGEPSEIELVVDEPPTLRGRREPPLARAAADGDAAIDVVVSRPDGSPAAGALVALRAEGGPRRDPGARAEVRAAGADGRVRFDGLAPGTHALAAVSGVFGPLGADSHAWRTLELAAGESALVELASAPSAALTGTVRAAGRPLAAARVLVRPRAAGARVGSEPAPALATESGPLGTFAFAGLPPGEYDVELDHPSRALPWRGTAFVGADGAALDVELGDAVLGGFVRDERGMPLAGARVRVLGDEDEGGWPDGSRGRGWSAARVREPATTDATGRFELAGLEPGVEVRLEAACAARATARSGPALPGDELVLALARAATLELELAASAGDEPRFALLRARGPSGELRVLPLRPGRPLRLDDLAAGAWSLALEARAERGEPQVLGERVVELVAGETMALRWEP